MPIESICYVIFEALTAVNIKALCNMAPRILRDR